MIPSSFISTKEYVLHIAANYLAYYNPGRCIIGHYFTRNMKIWLLEYERCASDRRWECDIPEKGRFESKVSETKNLYKILSDRYVWARKSPGENFSENFFFGTCWNLAHYPSGWLGCALWFLCFFHPCHGTKYDQEWEEWRSTLRRTAKTSCQKKQYVRQGARRPRSIDLTTRICYEGSLSFGDW